MKRIYLSLLMLITFITSLAQFKITPEGFRTEADHTFYVANMNGTTEEIFGTIEDVVCKNMGLTIYGQQFIEGQTREGICIGFLALSEEFLLGSCKNNKTEYTLVSSIAFQITIKNNKMMFGAPQIMDEDAKNVIFSILTNNHQQVYKKCIEDIENKINKMINEIIHKTDISCW